MTPLRTRWSGSIVAGRLISALALLALLTACARDGPAIDRLTYCAGWEPILISQLDELTEGTAQQIEGHNEHGADERCWKPPAQ